MADLNPEVMNALVRLVNGELNYDEQTDEQLFDLARASRRGRLTLHEVTLKLRERGYKFAEIGERLGVTESAASHWVDPPRPPGRRPQQRDEEDT